MSYIINFVNLKLILMSENCFLFKDYIKCSAMKFQVWYQILFQKSNYSENFQLQSFAHPNRPNKCRKVHWKCRMVLDFHKILHQIETYDLLRKRQWSIINKESFILHTNARICHENQCCSHALWIPAQVINISEK